MKVVIASVYGPMVVSFRGDLIADLIKRGHDVHCLAPEDDHKVAAAIHALGATYEAIPFNRVTLNPLSDVKARKHMAQSFEKSKPDVVISFGIRMAIWATLAAADARVPSRVAVVTGLGTSFMTPGLKGILLKSAASLLLGIAFRKSTCAIVQNDDDKKELEAACRLPSGTIKIVPGSGINTERFQQRPMPPAPVKFLLTARLVSEKGVREYAAAAAKVRESGCDAEFHIVGSIDSHPSSVTEAELTAWQSSGLIKWHGRQPDVRPFLENSHVFVLPSYREGLSRSVLEAMATGRAIITTDTPGCRSTIENGVHGYLVPIKDSESLAEAMLKFCREPALAEAMGKAASRRAHDVFGIEAINHQTMTLMGIPNVD